MQATRSIGPLRDHDAAKFGAMLVKSLYATVKLGVLYGFEGRVAQDARSRLMRQLSEAFAIHGGIVFRMANETLYMNDTRLRMDFGGFIAFRYLVEFLSERCIGEFVIPVVIREPEVVRFLKALLEVDLHGEDPYLHARQLLERNRVEEILIGPPRELSDESDVDQQGDLHDASIKTFFRSVFVARGLFAQRSGEEAVEIRKAKRVVHEMVDVIERDDSTLLALVGVKSFGDYVANHATNVAALAIAVGLRIGLPRSLLADLGVSALLHDCGRLETDQNSTCGDTEPHSVAGARLIVRDGGFSDGAMRAALTARWHHDTRDSADGGAAPLVHRIVRVVDFYDTLTTSAGPGHPPLHSETVIRLMARDDGSRFDPLVVRALGSVLGPHPFGTVVDLDTGERGIVYRRNPHADDPFRPVVKVFADADGEEIEDGPLVDLARYDREKSRFEHEIVQASAPSEVFRHTRDFVHVL